MNKNNATPCPDKLKSLIDESHNAHDNLIALVKFLARKAAEDDYANAAAQNNQTDEGEEV